MGGSGCGSGSESLLSVGDELVDGLALESGDEGLDLSIIGFALDTADHGFDIFSGYIVKLVLISFFPERVRRA